MRRGRPRGKNYPRNIDPAKIPDYCYWDAKGHWFTIDTTGEKPRRFKIAGADATMWELHQAMEGIYSQDFNTLAWLYGKFKLESTKINDVGDSQRTAWDYAFKILSNHPTLAKGVMLSHVPLTAWDHTLSQKTIDSVGKKNGPSAARRVRDFIRTMFQWGCGRKYSPPIPFGKLEMPKLRNRQRLPPMDVVNRVQNFARERGSQMQKKGSCAPYIWTMMVIARKCRLRGVEVRTMNDKHLLDEGIDCQRRKGSRANITRVDPLLQEAVDAAVERRLRIFVKKGIVIPFKPEKRLIFVGVSGQEISRNTWQNAWKRLMDLAVREGIIEEEERFGAHDLKRRGITDTPGTQDDRMQASGHKSRQGIDPYDKSIATVDPAPG